MLLFCVIWKSSLLHLFLGISVCLLWIVNSRILVFFSVECCLVTFNFVDVLCQHSLLCQQCLISVELLSLLALFIFLPQILCSYTPKFVLTLAFVFLTAALVHLWRNSFSFSTSCLHQVDCLPFFLKHFLFFHKVRFLDSKYGVHLTVLTFLEPKDKTMWWFFLQVWRYRR